MQQPNKIQQAQEIYNKVRGEEEKSLIEEVIILLKKYQFTSEQINVFVNDKLVVSCENKVFEVQRINLNRFWNLQLMQSEKETIEIRYNLLHDGSIENWLKWFEKIVPFIKDNNLPKRI